jgi:hypothetical protein
MLKYLHNIQNQTVLWLVGHAFSKISSSKVRDISVALVVGPVYS